MLEAAKAAPRRRRFEVPWMVRSGVGALVQTPSLWTVSGKLPPPYPHCTPPPPPLNPPPPPLPPPPGLLVLMAAGVASMFVPITSAWYPLLHNVYLYGGLTLFTLYIAYDTQKMIDEYEMGQDDHLKHAVDLFIDFKAVFMRVLSMLMMRGDD